LDKTSPAVMVEAIKALCEKHWEAHRKSCSGFVQSVAVELGVTLRGQANDMAKQIQKTPWRLLTDGVAAQQEAAAGQLVIGGLEASPHGHVVIVVDGPLSHGRYPTAYWGSIGGVAKKHATVNWSWGKQDRDRVLYASLLLPRTPK